jgi:hypothetical protein
VNIDVNPNVLFTVPFTDERYNNGGVHSMTVHPERLTAVKTGVYLISANILWSVELSGIIETLIRKNGPQTITGTLSHPDTSEYTPHNISTPFRLTAGDYVTVVLYQTSTNLMTIIYSDPLAPEFAIQWLGP